MPEKAGRRLAIYLPHHLPIWRLPQGAVEAIQRRAGRRLAVDAPHSEAAFARILPEAEVLFTWGLARRHVEKAKSLRWLHTPLAGVDRVLNPDLVATDIRVTSSRGVNAVAVAEHILGLILALTRGIADAVRAQARGRWIQEDLSARNPPLDSLPGKLLGIYGMGEIGRALAPRAGALGMTVWGVTRTEQPRPDGVDRMVAAAAADRVLRAADVLVLAVPLTAATRGMIGERELRRMKHGAILINIGRGALVQESALVRALRENWIAGAGLDVFDTEPLPRSSPLWSLPQAVLTPHVAGTHPQYMALAAGLFLDNLKRYLAGEPLLNEVDRKSGY